MQTGKRRKSDVRPFGRRLEGYTFADTPGGRAQYIYTGEYYSRVLSERAFRRRMLLCFLLVPGAAAVFLASGVLKIAGNATNFNGLVSCLLILLFLWLAYILVVLAIHKNRLTVWAYRVTALQYGIAVLAAGVLMLLSAVFTLVYALARGDGALPLSLLASALRLLAAAALLGLAYLEYRTEYRVAYPDSRR